MKDARQMKETVISYKRRFISGEKLTEKELLSLLLSYAVKNADTDDIAEKLLFRFGSLGRIFESSTDSYTDIDKLGTEGRTLLSAVYPILSYAYTASTDKNTVYDNIDKIARYLVYKYIGRREETVYLMLLDSRMHLIDCVKIDSGTVNESYVSNGKIARLAISSGAYGFILAHNHPGGTAIPSASDISTTGSILAMSEKIGVKFIEHIVVSHADYIPIMLYVNGKRAEEYPSFYGSGILHSIEVVKKNGFCR